jgi:hypothetical protein
MKKQFLLFLTVFSLMATVSRAQFLNYYANFINAGNKMNFTCVVPKNCSGAGNVYAIGTIDTTVLTNVKYIYVAEIDPNGNIVWDKKYSIKVKPADINDYFECTSAIETYDGYLVIAGNRRTPGQYKSRGFVIKIGACYNPKGLVWFKQSEQNTLFTRIVEKSVNPKRYYVSGQDMQEGNFLTGEDALLMEVMPGSGNMNLVSNRKVSGSDTWSGLVYDQPNDVFYTGGRYNYNSGNSMMRQSITKLDGIFNELWSYPYVKNITSDEARLYLYDLLLSNSGLYGVGVGDMAGQGLSLSQQFLATDLNGTLLAGKDYVIAGSTGTLHQVIAIPGSTDLLLLGDMSDPASPVYGSAYILRVDASGNIIWANKYPFSLKNYTGIDPRISGMTIQGGSLYAVGQYLPPSNIPQAALLKVNPANGHLDCADTLGITVTPITYQGPLTPMTPETYIYSNGKVKKQKIEPVLDWNTVCVASNPCGNDTTYLGDVIICAGGFYNICNQNYTTPGYYVVSCTGGDGCLHTFTFYLVFSSLTANAGPNASVGGCCAITLNGSASGGSPGYAYTWSPATGLSNTNIANPSCTSPGTYTLTVTDAMGCTSTDVVVIGSSPSCCKSGLNGEHAEEVQVFPNPSSGDFTIEVPGNDMVKVMVYNTIGQTVKSFDYVGSGFQFGNDLPGGTYLISFIYDTGITKQVKVTKLMR